MNIQLWYNGAVLKRTTVASVPPVGTEVWVRSEGPNGIVAEHRLVVDRLSLSWSGDRDDAFYMVHLKKGE